MTVEITPDKKFALSPLAHAMLPANYAVHYNRPLQRIEIGPAGEETLRNPLAQAADADRLFRRAEPGVFTYRFRMRNWLIFGRDERY